MFKIFLPDIKQILHDFKITSKVSSFIELQRTDYEKENPDSREVRLIDKASLADGSSVVIRFKNENDVTQELVEKQSRFAEMLRTNGISCPRQYRANDNFAKCYSMNGYDVIVTVEEFVDGELTCVTPEIAEKTGRLLAQTHNIAERNHFHVKNPVLFDPFTRNDLFAFTEFKLAGENLADDCLPLYQKILDKYSEYMQILSPLQDEPRFAVQGDISICNLYQLNDGNLGIFDFNRCGDNNLYCDAVMQAVFEARLMDYPQGYGEEYSDKILLSFLSGYQSERPFSSSQQKLFPYLYSIIDAFWASDIVWDDNSLLKEYERKNTTAVHKWLEEILKRLSFSNSFQIL